MHNLLNSIFSNRLLKQVFIRYALVGITGTITHYTILVFFVEKLYLNVTLSTTFGFICGAVVNYILNYRFTFNSTKNHLHASYRFFTIALLGMLLNALLLNILLFLLPIHYIISQCIATLMVLTVTFSANKTWTY